jgi:hypothetical protein
MDIKGASRQSHNPSVVLGLDSQGLRTAAPNNSDSVAPSKFTPVWGGRSGKGPRANPGWSRYKARTNGYLGRAGWRVRFTMNNRKSVMLQCQQLF